MANMPPLQNVSNPWEGRHDLKTTQETIKKLLAGGTPNWVKWPKDYKSMAQEALLSDRETSEIMARQYKMEDQELLLNEVARKVNPIRTRDFVDKLRRYGVKCYTIDNGFPPATVALWAFKPGTDHVVPVCYLQVPAMYEWSVLRLDKRGLPSGEAFRGWRTVESQLVEKGVISEARANEIFGRPVDGEVSRRFRRNMHWFRNRRNLQHQLEQTEI
ncbi:Uncharacterised protein [uncultured archaeon]|nr:Uncharacterised protein [uncultured archaeon]